MIFPLANFSRFCTTVPIPAKDHAGVFYMRALYSTQRYFLREVAAGLEQGVHDFDVLKGRQQGITALSDALDVYWPQKYEGIQGLMVADDDANQEVRRDIIRTMYYGADAAFQLPVRADNAQMLAWQNGSRLMFAAATSKARGQKTKLGRGRAVNYIHADEFDAWNNERAVMGLRASRSDRHPCRLYIWASTAQGHGALYHAWKEDATSPTTRRIFIPSWRHDLNRVERDNVMIWDAYAHTEPSADERLWMRAVKDRYDVEIPPEYLVWYRWKLATDMKGDETMMAQEHPNLEEDAFQSFGDKFFKPTLIRHLRGEQAQIPEPVGYRYAWGQWLDTTRVMPCEPHGDATVTVWEEPDPEGVYIIACHPAFSSSSGAADDVIQVWRAYPDQLVQAAEYVVRDGDLTVRCAWAAMILVGLYRMRRRYADVYFVMDVEMTGYAVSEEIDRIERRGASLSPRASQDQRRDFQDVMGAVRHYLFRRPDSFSSGAVKEWKSQPTFRPWVLNQVRDALENGRVEVRSEPLIDELANVRRGDVDKDVIAAGEGETSECRVLAMAMACEYYLQTVQGEIEGRFTPREPPTSGRHVGEVMVGSWLEMVRMTGGRR